MKRKILFAILLFFSLGVSAQGPRRVPATPHPIDIVQPNGDTLTTRLIGDERFHYRTTLDGYLIAKNAKGWYCYAQQKKDGQIKPTCRKAHNEDKRCKCEQRYLAKHGQKGVKPRERKTEE